MASHVPTASTFGREALRARQIVVKPNFHLPISLEEICISLTHLHISLEEMCIFLRETYISFLHLYKWLFDLCISSAKSGGRQFW